MTTHNNQKRKSVAVVTGIGGDIGKAIASEMLKAGHVVIGVDIDEQAAREAADTLDPHEGRVIAVTCDITDEEAANKMAEIARGHGAVAVLVNNAGGVTEASLQAMSVTRWKEDVELNLNGAFVCFQALADDLRAVSGCVVNIASVNGLGTYGHPAYSSAKAGLVHFTRMIAVEYGKFGVRANAVAPGTVRTVAWDERARNDPDIFKRASRPCPLGRISQTTDVADAVAFLASDKASAITGVCLPVDCGLSAGQAEMAGLFSQSDDY
ncbi:MAG TPA: SDR family oxidoreductase [Devosia sp.]|nr:SDR family oxidoreductase [Devosia sp.]